MNIVSANDFGSFLSIHDFIDQQKIPPSSKRLWGAIYGFYREYGVVYLCRNFFAKKLNLRKETISRALKVLENIGAVTRTGELKMGFYPCVELNTLSTDNKSAIKPANSQPVIKRSPISDQMITAQRLFDHPQKNKEEQIKEQTVVDFSKKEFSSNEKIALKQKLKLIGINKHSIEKLMDKFSIEKIMTQMEHLQFLLERGGIEKPASWLITAIEKSYRLPKEIDKSAIEEDQRAEACRKASNIAQNAKAELMQGNLQQAIDLASKSLLLAQNDIAKETIDEANRQLERAEKIKNAHNLISNEEKLRIRWEEEQKQLREMRRWRKNDSEILRSAFFQNAVDALVDERLLAAG